MTIPEIALLWALLLVLVLGLFAILSLLERVKIIERKAYDMCSILDILSDRQIRMREDTDLTKVLVQKGLDK